MNDAKLWRPRLLVALAFTLAACTAVAAAVALRGTSDGGERKPAGGIEARATVAPQVLLFGDTVLAHVDVVVDPARVDPGSVRVDVDVTPFEILGRDLAVEDLDGLATVRTTLRIRCATASCVPPGEFETYQLPAARIAFAPVGGAIGTAPLELPLPSLRVYSRFAALGGQPEDESVGPWRADLRSLPAPTYRLDPRLLVSLLLAAAAFAALVGGTLAHRAWPRRVPAVEPEPEPPPPDLTPLEQALALLERSIAADGAPGRRRALELVALELEQAAWGDRELAGAARALAWSEDAPAVGATSRVAARVRAALPPQELPGGEGDAP